MRCLISITLTLCFYGLATCVANGEPVPFNKPHGDETGPDEQAARERADRKIGMLLAENPTVITAREKLTALFPSFTAFEKIAAAPHLVNLTSDDQFQAIVGFLKSMTTPAEAREAFFKDLAHRPPAVGWPALVEVIATPNHPEAPRARQQLTAIVGKDFGSDIKAWQEAVQAQLKVQKVPAARRVEEPPTDSPPKRQEGRRRILIPPATAK